MTYDCPQPFVTVDIVLLTLHGGELCAALIKRDSAPHGGEWSLPGGRIHTDEDEDALAAARRILNDQARIEGPYLEQLKTFASRHRDSRGWSVSIAYYALARLEQVRKGSAAENSALRLRPVDTIRSLPFDHLKILRNAVERVRSKTLYSSLPVHLMPRTFTLSELQQVYEHVLGGPIDKRSFRRRIEELDVVEPARGVVTTGAHRPAQRYRLKRHHERRLAIADKSIGMRQ